MSNHEEEHPKKTDSEVFEGEQAQFKQESQFHEQGEKKEEENKGEVDPLDASQAEPEQKEKKKVKLVDSGYEIVQARNVPSSANDQRNSGIVIRIKSLEEVGYLPAKVQIEIRNEGNVEGSQASTRQTKLVPKHNAVWDEDFYYNNNVVLDDNILFILKAENQSEYGRAEVRNLSLLRKKQDHQDQQIEREIVKLELKHEEVVIANLLIELSFYEREDILGGVLMPNLSLRPPPNFVPKYNAIDTYKPEFKSTAGSKANCFNFYDGGMLPGFDNVEMFPPKIQRRNKRVVQAE